MISKEELLTRTIAIKAMIDVHIKKTGTGKSLAELLREVFVLGAHIGAYAITEKYPAPITGEECIAVILKVQDDMNELGNPFVINRLANIMEIIKELTPDDEDS